VDAAEFALESLGAKFFRLQPSLSGHSLAENATAMQALKTADMVIDFLGLQSPAALRTGDRSPSRHACSLCRRASRCIGRGSCRRRRKKPRSLLRRATRQCQYDARDFRPHGTDFTVSLGEYRVQAQWGYSDEPGHWDHWPSGFLVRWPNEGSAQGRIVLAAGDTIFPFRAYVQTPITLTIDKGYITAIEGGLDAEWLKNFMGRHDREAYAVSHLGWGLSETADWGALQSCRQDRPTAMTPAPSAAILCFRPARNTDAGGKRDTLCHFDMPMRNCSLELDGKPVLRDGRVI